MKTRSIPGFLYAIPAESYETGPDVIDGFRIAFMAHDFGDDNERYIKLGASKLDVAFPEGFDPIATKVAALRKAEAEVRADMAVKLMRIENEISKLLCIEHVPQPEFSDDSGNAFA